MLSLLLAFVALSITTSAICSLIEAAVYAVPLGYVKHLADTKSGSGKLLLKLKQEMAKTISAILMLNTISNTMGPAVAGWMVGSIFGADPYWVGGYSILMTMMVLFFGEILPKTLGVIYCRPIARAAARPLALLLHIFSPFIWISLKAQEVLISDAAEPSVSSEEVVSLASIGRDEGSLDQLEGSVIKNVIGLDKVLVRDVLTPRVVVFRLPASAKIAELVNEIKDWRFTRIPLYEENDPDHLIGYVTQRDIYREIIAGPGEKRLKDKARKLKTWPELMRVDELLVKMFDDNEHICAVVDEHGALAGIITLEDIIEEIVGREIVDEYDAVSDMRSFAKLMRLSKRKGAKT